MCSCTFQAPRWRSLSVSFPILAEALGTEEVGPCIIDGNGTGAHRDTSGGARSPPVAELVSTGPDGICSISWCLWECKNKRAYSSLLQYSGSTEGRTLKIKPGRKQQEEERTGSFVGDCVCVTDSRGSPDNLSGFLAFLSADGERDVCTANRRAEF